MRIEVNLELHSVFPLAGVPVRRDGMRLDLYIPGLYWAVGRMLRAALADQPDRCERQAEQLLQRLPIARSAT